MADKLKTGVHLYALAGILVAVYVFLRVLKYLDFEISNSDLADSRFYFHVGMTIFIGVDTAFRLLDVYHKFRDPNYSPKKGYSMKLPFSKKPKQELDYPPIEPNEPINPNDIPDIQPPGA